MQVCALSIKEKYHYLYIFLPIPGPMILVYCPKPANRIDYVCDLLLGNLLGAEWKLTSSQEDFLAHDGPAINYSRSAIGAKSLFIPACGFLQERGVHYFVPEIRWTEDLPLLFPADEDQGLGFDLFAAVFYMVSRYEEYLPHKTDVYGRFEAAESFAFKNQFLQKPVVNHYALILKKELNKNFPDLKLPDKAFTFLPTYDIDVAYAYKGRGLIRSVLGGIRSLLQRDLKAIAERVGVVMKKRQDPFDTYDYQIALFKQSGIMACYFFLLGDYGHYDKNIAYYSKSLISLIKMIGDYAHAGIHPSFASNSDESMPGIEARRLSSILNQEVKLSRQHYLKLHMPATYQKLLEENMSHDFTMGFASQPGFRAGICSPFKFYDLQSEKRTPLIIVPFTLMDGSFRQYLGLNPEQSMPVINKLMDEVEKVGGMFVSLWHNDSLSDRGMWKGWKALYENMYLAAAKKHKKNYDPLSET